MANSNWLYMPWQLNHPPPTSPKPLAITQLLFPHHPYFFPSISPYVMATKTFPHTTLSLPLFTSTIIHRHERWVHTSQRYIRPPSFHLFFPPRTVHHYQWRQFSYQRSLFISLFTFASSVNSVSAVPRGSGLSCCRATVRLSLLFVGHVCVEWGMVIRMTGLLLHES